ncbi:hypothetical protein BT69DRAFT_1284337 [Atractiella rhizophila]|nr:hypothetical protein BT69DRAFT_1284337 [Atractiella rhizophila]
MEFRAPRAYPIRHALQRFCVKYCTTFGVYALSELEWKQVNIIADVFKPYKDATMILQPL